MPIFGSQIFGALSQLVALIALILPKGINEQRDDLLNNTLGFVEGFQRIMLFYGGLAALVNHH